MAVFGKEKVYTPDALYRDTFVLHVTTELYGTVTELLMLEYDELGKALLVSLKLAD